MKDDSVYLLNDAKDILHEKLLKNDMDDDDNMDENVDKVLLLTTELLEKYKRIEITKKSIYKKNEE